MTNLDALKGQRPLVSPVGRSPIPQPTPSQQQLSQQALLAQKNGKEKVIYRFWNLNMLKIEKIRIVEVLLVIEKINKNI